MRISALFFALVAAHAGAQCAPGDYAQYKDKAVGPDGARRLAGDLCMVQINFRGALSQDDAMATRRNPVYLKNGDACIGEMRKIMDAAAASGIADEVQAIADARCPQPRRLK